MMNKLNSWQKIRIQLEQNDGTLLQSFNQPASSEAIGNLEKLFQKPLPRDFVDYLLTFNGQNHQDFNIPFLGSNVLFSVEEIIQNYLMQIELFGNETNIEFLETNKIQNRIWDKGWIPFGGFMAGNWLVLDLNPTSKGTYGQVLQLWSGQDLESEDVVIATTFQELSFKILDFLSGKCSFDDLGVI